MKYKILFNILGWIVLFLYCQCQPTASVPTVKYQPQDPFRSSMAASQYFELDAAQDQVIEGYDGTIVVFPKGCFLLKGHVFAQKVRFELAEALKIVDMLCSNLTTTAKGKLLETGGMLYFNATTAAGEQLQINTKIPIHIEIPTANKKAGMKVYQGIRDENGNMDWIKPKPLDPLLTAMDILSLDFLPPGFYAEVEKNMPFGNYDRASIALGDSLYYSMATYNYFEIVAGMTDTDVNEAYYNQQASVKNGQYTSGSYNLSTNNPYEGHTSTDGELSTPSINPEIIKVIKSEKFQNTLLATREFEQRMPYIFQTCDNAILETYINNLDKNLWELDEIAAKLISYDPLQTIFQNFANQRLTKVKGGNRCSELLKQYYKTALAKVHADLAAQQDNLTKALREKNEAAQKNVEAYQKLLQQRENYRMETYGFEWTETGWINVDNGTIPKDWGSAPLEIIVDNSRDFDRTYSYLLFTSIKSLYRLNTDDGSRFYVGSNQTKEMLMPNAVALAIVIGYKDNQPALATRTFQPGDNPNLTLHLSPVIPKAIAEALAPYDDYAGANDIATDLTYMKTFYMEHQRQQKLKAQIAILNKLRVLAYPCYLQTQ